MIYVCKDLIVQINTEAKSAIKALNLNEDRAETIIREVYKQYKEQDTLGKSLRFTLENYNNNELIFALFVLSTADCLFKEKYVNIDEDEEGDDNE